jgi:YidC/Oxa1 family membrane protein insertase
VDDYRNHALVTRARKAESLRFDRVSPLEVQAVPGPLQWAATKSKYFVAAILAVGPESAPLSGAVVQGGPRIDRIATHLDATVVLPLPQAGVFGFDVYLGPQEASRLRAIGNDFQNINPYGWVLRPVIMPIASVVVSILVWMHENLNLAYGWVLVLFGLGIRLILWPLNQRAMESQMRMQAAQPYMKEIQEKYKGDPQRLQQEMLKVYKEYNFNPLGGCLPMLIPMPVLFALFFVFANTIEFRGVPFLWLPDLSRADPLYIIPLVMGASMFALMKLGQRGVPPNPQTKVMAYFMPAFMTLILLRFASGLNLYYAAQNIFSLPQQWLISRKRLAASGSRSGG